MPAPSRFAALLYCRIFTNTTANRTIEREVEPEGTRLTTPVKATVWRGWQMKWARAGAYRSGLDRTEAAFCKAAMTEYFTRDNADIVTFLTRPAENTGAADLTMPFNVPGVTSLFLSPEQGSNNNSWDGDTREKLLSGVLFNKERFSQSRSAIGSLPLSNDADYTNCCAVVAELVEKDRGAKVKVVSVNVSQTNGLDYATLFSKLNRFKNERTILLFQSMDWSYHAPLRKQATASLDSAYRYLGEYNAWPTYQFAYATTNCVSASAEIPAPLSVLKSNGQPSGVHTNQAFCATVTFEAPQPDPEPGPSPVVADGDWFHAIPDGHGGSIETNGVWTTPPVATNAASYTVGATSEFTLTGEAQSAGSNRLVRAEADLVFDGTCTLDSLSDVQTGDSLAAIVAIEGDGGGEATWAACVGGMWIQMEGGATPTNGGIYRLRMEGDFTIASPRVRLSISADGGSTFGTLRHGGEEWLAPNNQARRHFSAVATDGPGELAAIRGALPDAPGAARRTIFIIQ